MVFTEKQKINITYGLLGLGAVALIIFGIYSLVGGNKKDKSILNTPAQSSLSTNSNSEVKMSPIVKGEYIYKFDDIKWEFEKRNDDKTKVSFRLDNFSRKSSGMIANLARPFYAGWYDGSCVENKEESIVGSEKEGMLISSVVCTNGDTQSEVALLQNDLILSVYDSVDGEVENVRDIDMSSIAH